MESSHFRLYTQEIFSNQADSNQVVVVKPGLSKRFADILVNDWPLHDESGANAKVVGRVQGQLVKADHKEASDTWDVSSIISFEDNKFKGSTLVVRGLLKYDGFEWAIVGRTGQFTLAQGIIQGKKVKGNSSGCVIELCFHVFYRAIDKADYILQIYHESIRWLYTH